MKMTTFLLKQKTNKGNNMVAVAIFILCTFLFYMVKRKKNPTSISMEFNNKMLHKEHAIYKADILADNTLWLYNHMFFPAEWPQQKVIEKIYEAYENFKSRGADAKAMQDGKYIVQGLTKEGIEVEMVITKDATIKTAYPTLWNFNELR